MKSLASNVGVKVMLDTGCSLAKGTLDGTTVTCGCHGSQFDVANGAVLRGPACRAVRSRVVQVQGDLLAEAS